MPRPLDIVIEDMVDAIEQAQNFVAGMTIEHYQTDARTQRAVERCLEIISEASRNIPRQVKDRYSGIPWGKIAGIGNILRHDYQNVANQIIWDTVQLHLPELLETMQEMKGSTGGRQ